MLDSSSATSAIAGIQGQTNNLRQTFTQNNILKVDSSSAVSNINKASSALDTFKKGLELIGAYKVFDLIIKGAGDLKNAIIGTNASIEQAQLKFTALTGSVQTANTLMGQLETLAAHSTFGLPQITAAAGGLLAFGVNVKNIPPLLNAMQNAAAAAGGDMEANFSNLSRILGELAGGLPLTERQIRQLVTAGIPLQPLAQQLGITVNQLLDVGKTGIVTGDQLVAAFAKVYTSGNLGDFMQKQAGTFAGAMALIKTNVGLAAASAFKPLFDAVSSLVVKFGEFVQTPTFNSWVAQIQAGTRAVIGVFTELLNVLAPVGQGLASIFGLNTANIGAEMAAVKSATVDVGQYDAALQGSGESTDNTKEKLAAYKRTIDDARLALVGINGDLAVNKQALDANAEAIENVKNKYDPTINAAKQTIQNINLLSPEEVARKKREMQLDLAKANLDLTKPDTSSFDAKILDDQTKLANMPRLDTSTWDDNIAKAQASLETLQDTDPAAGLKNQIASIQDSIAGLNTDEFDAKINAIRDKLAEPAPDTHGISNQLATLEAQLAGGQISQSQFDTQYGTLSKQKQDINQAHQDSTTGLAGQLKLLEAQRADQALANKETAQADRQRIADLNDQVKVAEAGHKKDLADLQDYIKAQQKGKGAAEKADATARQKLQDDITKEGNLRTTALAPYTEALKKINDEQARNSALDAAAAATRALDLAPQQAALDAATQAEQDQLAPLLANKQVLDDQKTTLDEQKTTQDQKRAAAEAEAQALKDQNAALDKQSDILKNMPKPTFYAGKNAAPNELEGAFGSGTGEVPESPFVTQLNKLKQWLIENTPDIQKKIADITNALKMEVQIDLSNVFQGVEFVKAVAQTLYDVSNGNWAALPADLGALRRTVTGEAGTPVGVTGGGPNGNGQEIQNGPNLAGQMPQLQTGYSYQHLPPMTINPNPPTYPSGGQTPSMNGIQQINAAVDNWLKAHGLGALTSFGAAGDALKNLASPTQVSAGDLGGQMGEIDAFTQKIQDQLGDNGGAQAAIQSFKDQIVKEMGDGSDAATAVADAEQAFTDKFGADGTVPTALQGTGDATKAVLGDSGTVPTILQTLRNNNVPLTVAGLLKAFGQGGDAPNALANTGTAATKAFGTGGIFDQATANVESKVGGAFGDGGTMDGHLASFDSKVGGVLGTGGSAQGDMTAFDSHSATIFGGDGTVIGYFTSVMNWLNGDWKNISSAIAQPFTDAQTPMQSFFSYLGGGISWLAEHFKLPAIEPYGGGASNANNNAIHVTGAHAAGLGGGMDGHWAMIGERGPEAMYVPPGATIIPNHMLPGHADGLNLPGVFDALLASKGGSLTGTAGSFSDTLAANLGAPGMPGVDGGGAALTDAVRGGVYDWLKASGVNIGPLTGSRNGGSGSGFKEMALAAYLAYLGNFGGPLDNESAFNDLMSVGQERNVDPRWFMAIMQTEDGFGTAAGDRLPQYNNYGGMGVRTGGLGFPSPIFATDGGPQPYAAFNSFRDFLEDEASWIAENGTSFLGYQTADGGQGKNAAYQAILAAIPALGGQAAGPFNNVSGGWSDVLDAARSRLGETFHDNHLWDYWCEQFVETVDRDAGIGIRNYDDAWSHASSVTLNSGTPPPGASAFWSPGNGWSSYGHTAISMGDGSFITTGASGIRTQGPGWLDSGNYRGWAPPGLKDGAYVTSPTLAMIGEGKDDEIVAPLPMLRDVVRQEAGGGTPTFVFHPGAITVAADGTPTVNPSRIDVLAAHYGRGGRPLS